MAADAMEPGEYLAYVLGMMERRALNRDRVDWARFAEVSVSTLGEAHTVIGQAVKELGDPHTLFLAPQAAAERMARGRAQEDPLPTGRLIEDRFAYLAIPSVVGWDEPVCRYVTTGAALVSELDGQRPDGWAIDLRGNTGGNMYPMITVVAPLLGDGPCGAFVKVDGSQSRWELHEGEIRADDLRSPVPNPYMLAGPRPKIAILVDGLTMSAAEATMICFLGLPGVRTFGTPTGGFATGNETVDLHDGARLILTSSREADRLGRLYDNTPIPPDEQGEDALALALAWLR